MTTLAGVAPKFEMTTPHGDPAASFICEYSLSRSTAQNSQPTFEPWASAASQPAPHAPPKQNSPFWSQLSTNAPWPPSGVHSCTSLPTHILPDALQIGVSPRLPGPPLLVMLPPGSVGF